MRSHAVSTADIFARDGGVRRLDFVLAGMPSPGLHAVRRSR
jgi:hypothetical protein